MKILAVIPARGGSRGIPNKNIRLLKGKPLISYSIDNAINSKFITDIVVTTDSAIIQSIAEAKGIKTLIRKSALCQDNTTLDAVIFDAQKGKKWDYIVTLQPTSPTLLAKTLDLAIEYTIKNNFDSVISVYNHPHLAWSRDINGSLKPLYLKRLNRQYLPAHYEETGAFLICKGDIIKEDSRLGTNNSIFEISEEEAIDIDTFNDFRLAESILSKKKVGIYVNGNPSIGLGHIYRTLEIADEFLSKPDIFFDKNITDISSFGTTKHNLIPVNGSDGLFNVLKNKDYDLFINDVLSTDIVYMAKIKKTLHHAKIVNFEDDGEGAQLADLVINALYENSNIPNAFCGDQYYISPKLFLFYPPIKIKNKVSKVFICFGGSDPQNYTEQLMNIIENNKTFNLQFIIVIGKANKKADELLQRKLEKVTILYNVENMPTLMSQCDIAVTSRGRTAYELATLGIPTISIAQNEREALHTFISAKNGFDYLGISPSAEIITKTLVNYINSNSTSRSNLQKQLLAHNLREGRARIMHLIRSL